jgi:putative membrane protein
MGTWMVLWMTIGVLVWAAVAAFFVALFSGSLNRGKRDANPPSGDGALEVARNRYARGEITEDEFERIRQNLG